MTINEKKIMGYSEANGQRCLVDKEKRQKKKKKKKRETLEVNGPRCLG